MEATYFSYIPLKERDKSNTAHKLYQRLVQFSNRLWKASEVKDLLRDVQAECDDVNRDNKNWLKSNYTATLFRDPFSGRLEINVGNNSRNRTILLLKVITDGQLD